MKTSCRFSLSVVAALLLFAGGPCDGYDVPSEVFEADKVTEALAAAKAKGKPIAFIQSDATTTCGLCSGATLTFFDEFRSKAVLVHFNHKEKSKLPEFAAADFGKFTETFGKYIPGIAFYDPETGARLSKLGYAAWSADEQGSIRKVKRELSGAKRSTEKPVSGLDALSKGTGTPAGTDVDPASQRTWKDRVGRVIEARLEKLENGTCTFVMTSGEKVSCPLAELSPDDQKIAGKFEAASE